ncbi:GGDEF domain-containing protein [Chimaeribacter arupi]|uniref:diguanylate cyclase n=2 Tax=Yersiniaceae TaxID=1903411 RepID=A0A2N5ERX9_9GAMM|nr:MULTISPECIES: GGDEF domain-containing protein [Yersiniaceae]MBS0971410.1 GGDEF domain-containing protein [Nissabacter archeti]MDV5138693.1 GGDEF domain-containing protein [Chimaeribacter arupi]PLR32504.1 GGDEF domain-containing protein [Chimaeribacter arupi]PLR43290.1 GGDEF domain-containing protein [Chimaeribacter arupi]PLR50741.1 GGDEF domain-containing protein [Chimaeribacter arupi]
MNLHSYDELVKSRHRLSLLLFLFLNTASSIFTMLTTVDNRKLITMPVVIIAALGVTGLLFTLLRARKLDTLLNIYSIALGILWAWHITLKYHQIAPDDKNFLLLSLFSVFFISAIALSGNFIAFTLHVLPAAIMVIYLDQFHNIIRILFTIALPMAGFSLHHLMQKRSDAFTRRLVDNLYIEREKFSDLSMLDPLTNLYNRRGLENRWASITAPMRPQSHYVLLMDIDHFKAYNDNYGHSMGDQALVRVAAAIRDNVRSRDIVVRYGGEEFMVLLTHVEHAYAMKVAQRIQQEVLALEIPHLFSEDVSTHVTLSTGIAPLTDRDWMAAVARADNALYRAKHNGRNAIEFAEEPALIEEQQVASLA